jgi:hypothetical protein
MTTYLMVSMYDFSHPLCNSDQITVPRGVWEQWDRAFTNRNPMFLDVGEQTGVVARVSPAVPSDRLREDSCRIPMWMLSRLGAEVDETWISLKPTTLARAKTIVLRARTEATLVDSPDPVGMLTDALSGADGSPSWACLTEGAELPLACGIFDVMELRQAAGGRMPNACILDCDVDLELVPALDHVVPVSPVVVPVVAPVVAPVAVSVVPVVPVVPVAPGTFVPFSGIGRRLCD